MRKRLSIGFFFSAATLLAGSLFADCINLDTGESVCCVFHDDNGATCCNWDTAGHLDRCWTGHNASAVQGPMAFLASKVSHPATKTHKAKSKQER
jgi:hypothetical protein